MLAALGKSVTVFCASAASSGDLPRRLQDLLPFEVVWDDFSSHQSLDEALRKAGQCVAFLAFADHAFLSDARWCVRDRWHMLTLRVCRCFSLALLSKAAAMPDSRLLSVRCDTSVETSAWLEDLQTGLGGSQPEAFVRGLLSREDWDELKAFRVVPAHVTAGLRALLRDAPVFYLPRTAVSGQKRTRIGDGFGSVVRVAGLGVARGLTRACVRSGTASG
jgi:hypothetical protein